MRRSRITTVILTDGAATRMRPLWIHRSKCMISFMAKPLLSYLIRALRSHGFTDIVLTSSGRHGEIKDHFSNGEEFGVDIRYRDEVRWYGTAATVKKLVNDMKDEISDTFMVVYGDSLLRADYRGMSEFHIEKGALSTILYHRPNFESFLYEHHDAVFQNHDKRTNYGVMNIDVDDRIVKMEEKPRMEDIEEHFANPVANAAVYVLEKEVLEYIPSDRPFDFARDLFPLLIEKDIPCFGFNIEEGYRLDIGTIRNYYNAHLAILKGWIDFEIHLPTLREKVWVGIGTRVDSSGDLTEPMLIGENSRIDSNTNIEYSVIGNNVHIGEASSIKESVISDNVHVGCGVEISRSIIGDNSLVGDGISIPENTVLGDHCRLGGFSFSMKKSELMGLVRK